MPTEAVQILSMVARELGISEDDLLKQGLRSFLERQLREVKAEIFEISGRYGVSGVTEMNARYRDGTLEEADSCRDIFSSYEHPWLRCLSCSIDAVVGA
jgi:hypothetical protein